MNPRRVRLDAPRTQRLSNTYPPFLQEFFMTRPTDERRLPGSLPTDSVCPELLQVVVECDCEEQQRALFEELVARGLVCRLLML